jgi:hypothetical protein
MTDNSALRVLGLSSAVVAGLALKYNDRALFDEHREGIASKPGWPIVGNLPAIIMNAEKVHQFFLEGFNVNKALTT